MAGRFHIQHDARAWLKNAITAVDSEAEGFEIFYLCALAGLVTNSKRSDLPAGAASELVDTFPGEFSKRSRLIIGLFLSREMRFRRIGLEEKGPLHRAIAEYVDPRSPSQLSEAGVKELSHYAFAGFERILEWFPDKPTDLESFLPVYYRKVNEALAAPGLSASLET